MAPYKYFMVLRTADLELCSNSVVSYNTNTNENCRIVYDSSSISRLIVIYERVVQQGTK